MKKIWTMMLALALTAVASAQQTADQGDEQEVSLVHTRGCRVGTPRPEAASRRAPSLIGGANPYTGNRRQLVVLASFEDMDFAESQDATMRKWDKIFNTVDYNEGQFVGSVHDYFLAQSYGQFNLTFDLFFVALPDTRYKYRSTREHDENSQYMVDDIVDVLQTQDIDWSVYDWDGDNYVDQLLIVFAGKGMSHGGGTNSIWPHQWWLSHHKDETTSEANDYRDCRTVTRNGKNYYIDAYCCVQEVINTDITKTSFGVICHEFSHCFGLPDFYYSGKIVGDWELMDNGNYNSQGYRPCNYSAHERMLMGWLTPIELTSATTITGMPALDQEPVAYVVRNAGARNECYFIENRQQVGWDENLPGSGILIFHIDYDKSVWTSFVETVNTNSIKRYYIIPANNRTSTIASNGWAYPYAYSSYLQANDSLTNTSTPAATLNNANIDGLYLMSKPITHMAIDANGLASFVFMHDDITAVSDVKQEQPQASDLMYDLQGRRLSAPAKGLYIQGIRLRIKGKTIR